jgi:arsenite-transporting ATPase
MRDGGATRIVLTTGKGGVGKTTVAAATAVHAAQWGHRTLVLSTDVAHSLADVLDVPLGHAVVEVAPRLHAQQLDGRRRLEESWSDIKSYVVELLGWAGADAIDAAELSSLPGLDEVFALENLRDHAASGRYDLIVVDCAPTAETLRLLALPEILGWYLERVFPTHRRVARLTRPVLRRTTSMPLAEDGLFDSFSRFAAGLDGVRELLSDRSVTTVRLVTTPEQVVVAETRRTYAYLALFGYAVDALVVNRMVDDTHAGPFFDEWRTRQRRALDAVDETFASLVRLEAPLEASEPVGPARLALLGKHLHGDADPASILGSARPGLQFVRGDGRVTLRVPLPGLDGVEVKVGRTDLDLVVTAGAYRRVVPLPDGLRTWQGQSARRDGDDLEVVFVEGEHAKST